MLLYLLWRLLLLLVRAAPPRLVYATAAASADFAYVVWRQKRATTIENMQRVLEDGDPTRARQLARRTFRNYARYVVDFIRTPEIDPAEVESQIEFDGWDVMEDARAAGKGIIAVLMHFGNWDLGAPVMTRHGFPVSAVADTLRHDRLNDAIVSARSRHGVTVIPIERLERSAVSIVRVLRRNEILALLIDRPMDGAGVPVRFFGSPTTVPAGPARLALRTGARLVPLAVARLDTVGRRYVAMFERDLAFQPTGDLEADVGTLTQALIHAHERFIRRFPDQWYVFRPLWSSQTPRLQPFAPGR